MKTLDLLEDLADQLQSFKLKAVQNGDTDIAIMLHKMRKQVREKKFDIEATQLCENV